MSVTGENAVKSAAAYLDKYAAEGEISWLDKDWRTRIDTSMLRMSSCIDCVLGQLQGGSFDTAVSDLQDASGWSGWDDVYTAFSGHGDEWKAYLTVTTGDHGIDTTATWVEKGFSSSPLKDLKVIQLNGNAYVAFLRSSDSTGLYVAQDFLKWYEMRIVCPFKGGDVLSDQDGNFYLVASEYSIIRTKDLTTRSYKEWIQKSSYIGDPRGRKFNKEIHKSNDYGSGLWDRVTFGA